MRGVSPKEGTNFTCYLYSFIDSQPLQSLHIENPIVEFAFGAFVSVNTLPLTKHLSSHRFTISSRRTARNMNRLRMSGIIYLREIKQGKRIATISLEQTPNRLEPDDANRLKIRQYVDHCILKIFIASHR
jgi:hypothetical protein